MVRLENGLSYHYYMLLYTACYNYCISNKHNEAMGYGVSSGLGGGGTVKGERESIPGRARKEERTTDSSLIVRDSWSSFDG
jgi:hypothetical protein